MVHWSKSYWTSHYAQLWCLWITIEALLRTRAETQILMGKDTRTKQEILDDIRTQSPINSEYKLYHIELHSYSDEDIKRMADISRDFLDTLLDELKAGKTTA